MKYKNSQSEIKTGCWVGAVIGALYGFAGPLICLIVAVNNMFYLWGSGGWIKDTSVFAKIIFYFFFPSVLPIIGGMFISAPGSSEHLEDRGGEIVIFFIANILIFAGFGYLIQQIARACKCDPDGLLKKALK